MATFDWIRWTIDGEHVRIDVNGESLLAILHSLEAPFDGSRADQYGWLTAGWLDKDHFLGVDGSDWGCGSEGKTVVLGCECGEPGCWPFMVKIDVGDDIVVWSEPEQPNRDQWSYPTPLFRFGRSQYEKALGRITSDLRR